MKLQITWTKDEPKAATAQTLVVPTCADHDAQEFEARFGALARAAVEHSTFTGKSGEQFSFTRERDGVLERVVLIGVGEGLDAADDVRTFAHDVVRAMESLGSTHVIVDLRWTQSGPAPWAKRDEVSAGLLLATGCFLGTYGYERFRSEDKRSKSKLAQVVFWADTTAPGEATERARIIASAVARARDLGNGPAELVTPTFLAETAKEIIDAKKKGGADVSLTVFDRAECEKRKMGCYLGVAKGSDEPPKFIHMSYRPKGQSKGRVCLIGKGVTFDSGGYSLKPSDGMFDMKMDMCGSAAVIGAFEGIVGLELPWEVHVIVAATENMVSGHAYRLGDVLTASNGKTVEINNTDAEGRLTMADALVYGSKLEPDFMIDFATLTGACVVALGPKIAGVMTHDEDLAEDWMNAAGRTGEPMWRLPLATDLKKQLESRIADMKNTGERAGGTITAGLFLSEFTEGRRWMHVDIAGPAMAGKAYGSTTQGATGFPVTTILEFLSGDVRKPQ